MGKINLKGFIKKLHNLYTDRISGGRVKDRIPDGKNNEINWECAVCLKEARDGGRRGVCECEYSGNFTQGGEE